MTEIQFSVFENLLKAPSKEYIGRLMLEAFMHRDNSKVSPSVLNTISETLDIDKATAEQLLNELANLVKKVLFDGLNDPNQMQALFAQSNLQANLKNLLCKLLVEKLPQFKKTVVEEQNMVPKLIDFDWRVDIKTASNLSTSETSNKSGQQTCILQLKTEESSSTTTPTTKQEVQQLQQQQMSRSMSRTTSISKLKPILDIYEIIKQQFVKRSEKQLGLLSFFARVYPNDKCGSNGLPLTPNSIRIYGKFQCLKKLNNKFICKYIDIQRGNHERLFVISEHYSLNLNDLLNDTYIYNLIIANTAILTKWFYQLLIALTYLSQMMIVDRYMSLRYICVTSNGNIKLSNYGLFHMTEYGYCVNFPIINLVTTAPECFVLDFIHGNKFNECPSNNNEQHVQLNNSKSDVWSYGVLMFQFLFGLANQKEYEHLLVAERIIDKALELIEKTHAGQINESSGYQYLLQIYNIDPVKQNQIEQRIRPFFLNLIKKCLNPNVVQRPEFSALLRLYEEYLNSTNEFKHLLNVKIDSKRFENDKWELFTLKLRSESLEMKSLSETVVDENEELEEKDHLWRRGVNEVYYLWKLAGGDCIQTLKQNDRIASKLMSIQKLPMLVSIEDGTEYGKPVDDEVIFDDTIVPLSLQQLRTRISLLKLESYYPLIENQIKEGYENLSISSSFISESSMEKQPLNIREADIEYQFNRLTIFSRYLAAYPFKKQELYKECLIDIPPIYRSFAWAALLEVPSNIGEIYSQIDKEIITPTDRQIDLDIPRCHQYDTLLASPEAHYRLKRVLKSWVLTNPHLVYWQGLDSLCAPFLHLNFNNEAIAFGCLTNFVNKYAAKFFLKDNSAVIQEYLAVFSHLIAFHDPELANHFESIDFRHDLFAIPWFLTMFAHVFPMYKIYHLWDTLLLGSSAFPLCIGVAILKQLRTILINSDFNDCILLFSELPEINIAKCVSDTIKMFSWTPSSCMYRAHSNHNNSTDEANDLDMTPLDLTEMRAQLCPRISAKDILNLYETNLNKLLLIDIRPANEFNIFNIIKSKNIPFETVNFAKMTQLIQMQINSANELDYLNYLVFLLQQNKNMLKVIISSRSKMNLAIELANKLVQLNFSKVCILNNGIECFKSTSIVIQIQQAEEYANQTPRIQHLNLELTKQTLTTMLDGLGKIKEQLNSVASK